MNSEWMTIITLAGTLFGVLISFHLITIRRPGVSVRWLGLYTFMLTAALAEPYVTRGNMVSSLLGGLSLLYGPLLYLYVKSRILMIRKVEFRDMKHLLPFLLYAIGIVATSFVQSGGGKSESAASVDIILYELLFIQIFWYFFKALLFIHRKKTLMAYEDEDVGKMDRAFLSILVIVSVLLFLGSYLMTHLYLLGNTTLSFEFKSTVQIGLCCIIFMIALLNTETMYSKKMVKSI